jgi:hypothetical protein
MLTNVSVVSLLLAIGLLLALLFALFPNWIQQIAIAIVHSIFF